MAFDSDGDGRSMGWMGRWRIVDCGRGKDEFGLGLGLGWVGEKSELRWESMMSSSRWLAGGMCPTILPFSSLSRYLLLEGRGVIWVMAVTCLV